MFVFILTLLLASCKTDGGADRQTPAEKLNIYNMDNILIEYLEYQPEASEKSMLIWNRYKRIEGTEDFDFIGTLVVGLDIFERENTVTFLNADGVQLGYISYEYDKNGRKTQEHIYSSDGEHSNTVMSGLYHYDDDGRHIKTERYNKSNELVEYFINEYDGDGSFSRRIRYDGSGIPQDYSDKTTDA